MADRYEASELPRRGREPLVWGAWDSVRRDWVRRPGTGVAASHPGVFTSEERVKTWAARQPGSAPEEREHLDPQRSRDSEQVV